LPRPSDFGGRRNIHSRCTERSGRARCQGMSNCGRTKVLAPPADTFRMPRASRNSLARHDRSVRPNLNQTLLIQARANTHAMRKDIERRNCSTIGRSSDYPVITRECRPHQGNKHPFAPQPSNYRRTSPAILGRLWLCFIGEQRAATKTACSTKSRVLSSSVAWHVKCRGTLFHESQTLRCRHRCELAPTDLLELFRA
jgi:hypothetical protein